MSRYMESQCRPLDYDDDREPSQSTQVSVEWEWGAGVTHVLRLRCSCGELPFTRYPSPAQTAVTRLGESGMSIVVA